MDVSASFKHCLQNWPKDLPQRGVVVTSFEEQIPFEGFLTSDSLVLFDRKAPDTTGARKVLLPYQNIAALKLIDVVSAKALAPMGLVGKLKE
ncbi:MAG: hypothetical protein WD847_06730 [Pirellulales bacterium]